MINQLVIRVTLLESKHEDLVQVKEDHTALLAKLVDQDNKAIIALNNINLKFDALIHQFSVGFKIFMICGSLISGFWIYNKDLDDKYYKKIDSIASNMSIERELISKTIEDVNKIKAKQ